MKKIEIKELRKRYIHTWINILLSLFLIILHIIFAFVIKGQYLEYFGEFKVAIMSYLLVLSPIILAGFFSDLIANFLTKKRYKVLSIIARIIFVILQVWYLGFIMLIILSFARLS